MIGRMAEYIAIQIYDEKNEYLTLPKIKFALHFFLNLFFVFITVLIFSIFLSNTYDTIVCFFSLILIRFISGGSWHFKNDVHCYVFSSSVLALIPLIPKIYVLSENVLMTLNAISLVTIAVFSPMSKRSINAKRKWSFKIISILMVLIQMILINSPIVALTYFFQSMSIIPFNFGKKDEQC